VFSHWWQYVPSPFLLSKNIYYHPPRAKLKTLRGFLDIKFLLLHDPTPSLAPTATVTSSSSSRSSIATNPTSPATEEAIRQFFTDVYEVWVKTLMNPFYEPDREVRSPVFRARVAAAGKKYL
jgi:trafficking protein particle complex subunit 2